MTDDHAEPIGYSDVDAQPIADEMVAGMEATARWPSVQALRAWEREHLVLGAGGRLLDVGCGIADASLGLADDLAPSGEIVAIDASEAMLSAARRRVEGATPTGVTIRLRLGDAQALDEPDASFSGVRSERVLQWLPDPATAVAEMARVLVPEGRLSLIDTDWRTFTVDLPPESGAEAVWSAMMGARGESAGVGSRLVNLARDAGLVDVECTAAVHTWTHWDPDASPGPDGFLPIGVVVDQMAAAGVIDAAAGERFVTSAVAAARADRMFMSVTMFAVSGRRP